RHAELVACTVRVGCGGTSSPGCPVGGSADGEAPGPQTGPPVTHAPAVTLLPPPPRPAPTPSWCGRELVPPRRTRSVHRTSWVRRYEFAAGVRPVVPGRSRGARLVALIGDAPVAQ